MRFNVVVDNLFDESDPLYYNTVMRPTGGDVTNPARVATPNLFSYLTPRSFKFSATVSF